VDVNVHPTKHEIRLVHQKLVHDTVRDAVADALRQADPTRWTMNEPGIAELAQRPATVSEPHAEYKRPQTPDHQSSRAGKAMDRTAASTAHVAVAENRYKPLPSADPVNTPVPPINPTTRGGQPARQSPLWKQRFFSDLTVIGQYKGTYIICESYDGLMLIDQHAAHERIVFEQLKRQSNEHRPASQRLLLPETIDLGFREAQILEKLAPELDRFGLEIEPFGGNTFVVKSIPTLIDNADIQGLVTQLVEKTAEIGVGVEMETILDECLMLIACHNAIRAHQQLTETQIKAMLEQLDACDNPSHCPHGRPIWILWSVKDLEKQFQRIV
jgi:DNA mismatch repair protein MutL